MSYGKRKREQNPNARKEARLWGKKGDVSSAKGGTSKDVPRLLVPEGERGRG